APRCRSDAAPPRACRAAGARAPWRRRGGTPRTRRQPREGTSPPARSARTRRDARGPVRLAPPARSTPSRNAHRPAPPRGPRAARVARSPRGRTRRVGARGPCGWRSPDGRRRRDRGDETLGVGSSAFSRRGVYKAASCLSTPKRETDPGPRHLVRVAPLDGFEERLDLPDRVVIQRRTPRRHALGGPTLRDGGVKNFVRVLAIALVQPAE